MIQRTMAHTLRELASEYPVITVTGPRQSGKTTLAQATFPSHQYVNLEDPESRTLAQRDPKGFFAKYPPPLIIDEFQRVPELTSLIQAEVDAKRKAKGRYILTGSHQALVHQTVSQTLAGRMALLRLLPLSLEEIMPHRKPSLDALILTGGMPELNAEKRNATRYYRNYFQTYVERDVRQMMNIRNLHAFERFVVLLAGRVGQVVNLSSLSGEVGVSHPTLAEWLSLLEASYLVYRLQPFFSNISKRIVRSPKIYFTETGLAAYLIGLETETQVSRDPLRGQLFENLMVTELLKARLNRDDDPRLFYLRTEKGFEIDIVSVSGTGIVPIEIKSSMSFHPDFAKNLLRFCGDEKRTSTPTLIYAGEDYKSFDTIRCLNHWHASQAITGKGDR